MEFETYRFDTVWRFDIFDINIVLTFEVGHCFYDIENGNSDKVDYIDIEPGLLQAIFQHYNIHICT